jgi:hypothetical protein
MNNVPVGFLTGDLPGWSSENVVNAFGLIGPTRLEKLYCGAGFDMRRPGSSWPRVRIGTLVDDTPSCTHPNSAEGIGFSDTISCGSSGSVDWRGNRIFVKAAVDVAGTALAEGDLRIHGVSSGRLSVYHAGKWGTICNNSFDNVDAQVVCRIQGFVGGEAIWSPGGTGQIWMDSLMCTGHETSILQCGHSAWGAHTCDHGMDAGVRCLQQDQHFEFVGCFAIAWDLVQDLAYGPHTSGYNTATCGVACSMYRFMALRDHGRCSCGDGLPFHNDTTDAECGPVCPGESDFGPTRYCGTPLRSAVYRIYDDFNETISTPVENASIPVNVTSVNITDIPLPQTFPALQYTTPQEFRQATGSGAGGSSYDTWLLEPEASALIAGRRYKFCTDLDGKADRLRVGDTGLSVFLSPLTTVHPERIQPSRSSELSLTCGVGGCAALPNHLRFAYLANMCGGAPPDESKSVCLANATVPSPGVTDTTPHGEINVREDGYARVTLNTLNLPSGRQYRLCLRFGNEVVGEDSGLSVTLVH